MLHSQIVVKVVRNVEIRIDKIGTGKRLKWPEINRRTRLKGSERERIGGCGSAADVSVRSRKSRCASNLADPRTEYRKWSGLQILQSQLFFRVVVVNAPSGSNGPVLTRTPRKPDARSKVVVMGLVARGRNSRIAGEVESDRSGVKNAGLLTDAESIDSLFVEGKLRQRGINLIADAVSQREIWPYLPLVLSVGVILPGSSVNHSAAGLTIAIRNS